MFHGSEEGNIGDGGGREEKAMDLRLMISVESIPTSMYMIDYHIRNKVI